MAFSALTTGLKLGPLRPIRSVSRFRRQRGIAAVAASNSPSRIVYLGTPDVAAHALQKLWDASLQSKQTSCPFQIAAVVTQKPAPVGRKRIVTESPVHHAAKLMKIDPILTPETARDPRFLENLAGLRPDLCITAAYGNFLPSKFLSIPRLGTVNLHPSLLPHFRGAAPVPRALQAGVSETGVSIAFTELKLDSGPIIKQNVYTLDGTESAPELLETLFDIGADMLISLLPSIFSGQAAKRAVPQNDNDASEAPKLSKDEGRITFVENAVLVHNKIRAFAGWPGTWADFELRDGANQAANIRLKLFNSAVLRPEGGMCLGVHEVKLSECGKHLEVTCDDGSLIALEKVQPPGKSIMSAQAFWNGLRGKALDRKRLPY